MIASVLDQDVQHDSVLVDGSPQPVPLPADLERHLVQMPLVAGSYASSTQPCRIRGSKLGAPLADGFVADDDPAFGEEIPNVTKAEVEAEAQPDGVGDDVGREAVAAIRRTSAGSGSDIRRGLSPIRAQLDNSDPRGPSLDWLCPCTARARGLRADRTAQHGQCLGSKRRTLIERGGRVGIRMRVDKVHTRGI